MSQKQFKQDRQCAYNVIMRRVRESLLEWKSNKCYIFVCVCTRAFVRVPGRLGMCMPVRGCSLTYRACTLYAPYCDVICDPTGSTTSSTLSYKRTTSEKKIIEHKMCVLILPTIVSKIFLSLRGIQRDVVLNVKTSSCKVPLFSSDCKETCIFSTSFRKDLKY